MTEEEKKKKAEEEASLQDDALTEEEKKEEEAVMQEETPPAEATTEEEVAEEVSLESRVDSLETTMEQVASDVSGIKEVLNKLAEEDAPDVVETEVVEKPAETAALAKDKSMEARLTNMETLLAQFTKGQKKTIQSSKKRIDPIERDAERIMRKKGYLK